MEIVFPKFPSNNSSSPILLFLAFVVTALGCFFATLFARFRRGGGGGAAEKAVGQLSGGGEEMVEKLDAVVQPEKQTGASMMEQLLPEVTTHVLSYLDYPSLCRLSTTNSLMRSAANDDNAWKALYRKDFTLEQDMVTPVNGWKAYYAATRAVMNVNNEFFTIVNNRDVAEMGRLWLDADYVKCFHASGEFYNGYNAVMQSWQLALNWDNDNGANFDVREVRVRVLTDMAWVTMKASVPVPSGPFIITNIYEFHNGRWFLVHHHSSVMLNGGDMLQG